MLSVKITCEASHQLKNLPANNRLQMILPAVRQARFVSVEQPNDELFVVNFHVNHGTDPKKVIQAIQTTLDDMSVHAGFFQVVEFKADNSAGWEPALNSYTFRM